jgi:D-alanine-D-alanine ligase
MKIGLTYDLRDAYLAMGYNEDETAELDKEETVEGIERAINELGYETERIGHLKDLQLALSEGKRWDLVFNICEGMFGIGREAQVPALLDAYRIPYTFSDPSVLSLTLHKGMTKRVLRDAGIATAAFALVKNVSDIRTVDLPFPLFVKPVAEGSGKGIDGKSTVYNFSQLEETCIRLLKTYDQEVLVEEFLPGREFTVGIVGTGENAVCVGGMEVIILKSAEEDSYSRFIKENYEGRVDYRLMEGEIAVQCEKLCLNAWRLLGCRDAGRIDVRFNKNGVPCFIEVNPLAGLNYIHSDLPIIMYKKGRTFNDLIDAILKSAFSRMKH